jgi:glycosyltransferase involved in cell wall biosynthesis
MDQPAFSIIVAMYGVEAYLEEFLTSLEAQTFGFGRLEVILVDDGSPDGSFEIAARWQQRHPDVIRCVRKPNGGVASARNAGIPFVTAPWVTFMDPDDLVTPRYFEHVDRFLTRFGAEPLVMVCTNLVYYDEIDGRNRNQHPLRGKFAAGARTVPISQLARDIHLATHTAFFERQRLEHTGLRFDERVVPDFEDAHFVARYLLEASDGSVGFVPKAKYRYRRRANHSSLLQTSWGKAAKFDASLRFGCLELFEEVARSRGEVPVWLQRTVLYHLQWYFRADAKLRSPTQKLGPAQLETFHELVGAIMRHIDQQTIDAFELGNPAAQTIWALSSYRNRRRHSEVALATYDPDQRLLLLRYFYTGGVPEERFVVDGEPVAAVYEKSQGHEYFRRSLFQERRVWIPVLRRAAYVEVELDGVPAPLVMGWVRPPRDKPELLFRARHRTIKSRLAGPGHRSDASTGITRRKVQLLRWASQIGPVRRRFRKAWIFLDRDTHADDNAEHLYRWVRRHHPDVNAWFLLDRSSPDWGRLRAEGFRLLPAKARWRALVLLNADHLISSHVDQYVVEPVPRKHFGDLMRWRFTFLQHGVTQNDLSRWLNHKPIDRMITATPQEHVAIVGDGSPYRFTEREVRRTGFPRHDALLRKAADPAAPATDTILIAPTWRSWLVGDGVGHGNRRAWNPDFHQSEYAIRWRDLLHDQRLERSARQHGKRIVFLPHVNVRSYLDWFDVPDHVEVLSDHHGSIQDLLVRTSVLVTDYSSIAFDVALLDRAVVYYQFDRDAVYGEHLRPGYFDVSRHGFGPVVERQGQLLDAVHALLERRGPDRATLGRIARTFPDRDGEASRRVFESIVALRELHPAIDRPRGESFTPGRPRTTRAPLEPAGMIPRVSDRLPAKVAGG